MKFSEVEAKIAGWKFGQEFPWLQVVDFDKSRSFPWACVDCRTGTIQPFKTSDDARAFAEKEGIQFFL